MELLLVMAIIAVLSSLALVVIGEAQHDARRNATQARMSQINNLLTLRMENYEVRRAPLNNIANYIITGGGNGDPRLDLRDLRRRILVDTVNAEMPRSLRNVSISPGTPGNPQDSTYPSGQFVQWVDDSGDVDPSVVGDLIATRPAFASRFVHHEAGTPSNDPSHYPEGSLAALDSADERRRSSSEYLYKILETTQLNGLQATASLGNGAFVDTDNDGFLEVVDSWGEPIGFQFIIYLPDPDLTPDDTETIALDATGGPLGLGYQDLDASYSVDGSAISVGDLRVLLYSRGNGVEDVTNIAQ